MQRTKNHVKMILKVIIEMYIKSQCDSTVPQVAKMKKIGNSKYWGRQQAIWILLHHWQHVN